jgi:hypothetical protein
VPHANYNKNIHNIDINNNKCMDNQCTFVRCNCHGVAWQQRLSYTTHYKQNHKISYTTTHAYACSKLYLPFVQIETLLTTQLVGESIAANVEVRQARWQYRRFTSEIFSYHTTNKQQNNNNYTHEYKSKTTAHHQPLFEIAKCSILLGNDGSEPRTRLLLRSSFVKYINDFRSTVSNPPVNRLPRNKLSKLFVKF